MVGRVEYLQPEGLGLPIGLYSDASRDNATGLVFVAGQVATGASGEFVGKGDFEAQFRQVFHNIGVALQAGGASYASVLKLTTYIVREADLPHFRRVRAELYATAYPDGGYPPHILTIVGLSSPDHLIEMEAIAASNVEKR